MKSRIFPGLTSGKEDGAVLIFLVLGISLMFVGLTALAIDTGHLVMVRNELQNSADAGSLAGASVLFNPADGSINTGANTEAEDVARENPAAGADRASGSTAVDKLDVVAMRGHWSFATETFTQNETTQQLVGWQGMTTAQLDVDTDFINAVQVTTTREHTKAIFANFFGQNDHPIETDAVAYIGFAKSVDVDTVDIPFAICKETITFENPDGTERVSCKEARSQHEGIEKGGWTNFSQDRPKNEPPEECTSSNANVVNNDILADISTEGCEDLNPESLTKGAIGTINGNVASTYKLILEHCFVDVPDPDTDHTYVDHGSEEVIPVPEIEYTVTRPWVDVTVPVVECSAEPDFDFAGGNCDAAQISYVGVVTLEILWMSFEKENVPVEYQYDINGDDIIQENEVFSCSDPNPANCWQLFQSTYGWEFVDPDNDGLPENKSIYFAPTCDYKETVGGTGNNNFGIMASIPVLVE